MPHLNSIDNDFLTQLTRIIEENISNEYFGVSELAREIGMSRSNLLRKVKKLTQVSVSQFIRQIRLQHAMGLLKENRYTVSEIAYKVGFSSTSYFIKCFREYYGYPPGQVLKGEFIDLDLTQLESSTRYHKLAAIMFTDIEGYTALMQKDEQGAIAMISRHRDIFNRITKRFNGKILQYYGDGTLSTFESAIDAVRCGVEMQLEFQEDPVVPVRIGIHSGDIMFTKNGVIGDGVNVASRIESLATTGSVFISEKVYDEVKNQKGIKTISLGKFELKNVGKAIEVFAVTNPGLAVPRRDQISGKLKASISDSVKKPGVDTKDTALRWTLVPIMVMILGFLLYNSGIFDNSNAISSGPDVSTKSIAVLPFINDSNDSSNGYFINGLMESTLNNLQKIKDLRVISRTSVEKYRHRPKTLPVIAEELNVKYIVEGSGQKIGNQILLNIQLIDAQSDRQLWSQQYNKEAKDIFALQIEVARNITDGIEVIITPEEEDRINKAPTDDLVAYDHFLKGLDILNTGNKNNYVEAVGHFKDAIQEDPEFARAYAAISIAYHYMDEYKAEKEFTEEINYYADQALLYDAQLPQSLIAKALFYMNNKEYTFAESYFEKALQYSPNYGLVYIFLVDLYTNYLPNSKKYIEYALKGLQLEMPTLDSVTTSFMYLHMSNAFIQSGFVDEAEQYINLSLENYPGNLFSEYLKAFIFYAKEKDLKKTRDMLTRTLEKDTSRADVIQEVAKISYYMRDYKTAYTYYNKLIAIKETFNLNIYTGENAKIALVMSKLGKVDDAEKLIEGYKEFAEADKSIYKHLSMAAYYSYMGNANDALSHLQLFSQQESYHYWTLLFTEIDPIFDNLRNFPEFSKILKVIEEKFWDQHVKVKISLKEKNLL